MLPFGPKYHLRLIALNMRDYHGSTPYTDEEVADFLNADVEVQTSAVRMFARELAQFLEFVCKRLAIPPIKTGSGGPSGGLVCLTWSMSGMGLVSMLGDPATLGDEQKAELSPFLRKVVLYGKTDALYGIAMTEQKLQIPLASCTVSTRS